MLSCSCTTWFSCGLCSQLVDSIPTSPSNVRVRSLREVDITKCQTGGMPCRDSKLRLSAAETQYFALCSVNLFGPYVDRTKECSFWDSWVKHIEYLRIMLQPTIKVSDLVNMSALIKEHQTLFAQVRGLPPLAARRIAARRITARRIAALAPRSLFTAHRSPLTAHCSNQIPCRYPSTRRRMATPPRTRRIGSLSTISRSTFLSTCCDWALHGAIGATATRATTR